MAAGKKNPQIKKANQEVNFTENQLTELAKCANDPVYFVKTYCKIQHPVKGAIPFELYPYQENMIQSFYENKYVVVLSARQTGKALDIETDIATINGWKKMKDISIGDTVFDANGKPTKVIGVSDIMYNHTCYKVEFSTGDYIIADAEHLWNVSSLITKKIKTETKTTEEILRSGIKGYKNSQGRYGHKYHIPVAKSLELPDTDLAINPYLLGVWLGDGTSRTGEITSHKDDVGDLVDNIISCGKELSELYVRPRKNTNTYVITLYGLRKLLKENNLYMNKHIPIQYLRASHNQRLELLRGLMDTDGSVSKGVCEISLSDVNLSNDVYELICSLGLKPSMKVRKTSRKDSYRITFSAYREFIEVFKLKRKLEKVKYSPAKTRKYSTMKREIIGITKVQSVPVKCIAVDNNEHLYLAGKSLIPTHNSVTSSAFLLWYSIFNFDKTVLIASNKNKNAMEMIHRIRYMYEQLPNWLKPGITDDGWNKHSVGFDNGSRIESTATSEDSGRGMSISLLYLDEFAFVKPSIQEEFWTSITPTLATGGSCIMTSTPNGDSNMFAVIWRGSNSGTNDFIPIHVKWHEPPGRDESFKKSQIGLIGERKWNQEYACEFLSSDSLLIDSVFLLDLTEKLKLLKPESINKNNVLFWEQIEKNKNYIIGIDPATGSGKDYSVISGFRFPEMVQVFEWRSNTMATPLLYTILKNLLLYMEKLSTNVYFSVENNGVGEGIIALYEADETPPEMAEFVSESGKNRVGFVTTAKSKMKACVTLKNMLERGKLTIKSKRLLAELKSYVRTGAAYAAQLGETDDTISAVLIVIRILEEISSYEQDAFDKLYSQEDEVEDYGNILAGDDYDPDDEPLPIIF